MTAPGDNPAGRYAVASRAAVPPFHVMDLLAAAGARQRSHGDMVNLVAGQPSTGAPAPVRDEAIRLLGSGDPLGYTESIGVPELRVAIAEHHRRRYGIDVNADDVIVTTGSSGGFLLTFLAAFEPGSRVAMARPGYACYRNVLQALGCQVVEIACGPENRFQPTVEQLAAEHARAPLAGLVLASPANPTGTMLLPTELEQLAQWCEDEQVQLVSDEIYHGIEFAPLEPPAGDPHAGNPGPEPLARTAWATSREAVVFGSFSKYFSMTGWRLGWMLAPQRLRRPVDVLAGNFTICPPHVAQVAAIQAFTDASYAELDGHVARYADNRRRLLDGLAEIGLDRVAPADGAFYVYCDIGHLTDDSMAFAHRLLAETGVAVAPGIDFDTEAGDRFIRLSFAGPRGDIDTALERLADSPLLTTKNLRDPDV